MAHQKRSLDDSSVLSNVLGAVAPLKRLKLEARWFCRSFPSLPAPPLFSPSFTVLTLLHQPTTMQDNASSPTAYPLSSIAAQTPTPSPLASPIAADVALLESAAAAATTEGLPISYPDSVELPSSASDAVQDSYYVTPMHQRTRLPKHALENESEVDDDVRPPPLHRQRCDDTNADDDDGEQTQYRVLLPKHFTRSLPHEVLSSFAGGHVGAGPSLPPLTTCLPRDFSADTDGPRIEEIPQPFDNSMALVPWVPQPQTHLPSSTSGQAHGMERNPSGSNMMTDDNDNDDGGGGGLPFLTPPATFDSMNDEDDGQNLDETETYPMHDDAMDIE